MIPLAAFTAGKPLFDLGLIWINMARMPHGQVNQWA
jgi:hypothetical protein